MKNTNLKTLKINENQRIVLPVEEFEFFIEEIEKPAKEPSEYSLRALEEYRKMFKEDVRDKILM